jgi:hypothetical protein
LSHGGLNYVHDKTDERNRPPRFIDVELRQKMKSADTKDDLERKIVQARKLMQQLPDQRTAESIKMFIADLENRLRSLER